MYKVIMLCCLLQACCCFEVRAVLRDFSAALVPAQKVTTSPQTCSVSQVYKAQINQTRLPDLKTAVLWHAPPYKSLTIKLSAIEAAQLDEAAISLLVQAAVSANEELFKAKNAISKKEPLVFKLGQALTRNTNSEALDMINKLSADIYQAYQPLKGFYQQGYSRDTRLFEQYSQARAKLELLSGAQAVASVESMFNKDRI